MLWPLWLSICVKRLQKLPEMPKVPMGGTTHNQERNTQFAVIFVKKTRQRPNWGFVDKYQNKSKNFASFAVVVVNQVLFELHTGLIEF